MKRRSLFTLSLLVLLFTAAARPAAAQDPPNVVIIFADDLGYGDIGVYGHPTIQTPHLDRMAYEGTKFTQFYTAASVCTPSRAALLTGRLPVRSGMASDRRRVLFPDSRYGLPHDEVTVAEALKERGYATAAIGKWHLGHLPDYLPREHGFDYYFGIPYSNDMDNVSGRPNREIALEPDVAYWNVPLIQNEEVVERPADQNTITRRYTEEAVDFIREHSDEPFFVYLAHSLPHIPLFRHPDFAAVSRRGLYGDVIEEIDWSVGQVLEALREEGLEDNTFVFFTSDNGPWLVYETHGGSAGLLRGGKGMTWDGGMHVPGIAWGPGLVPEGHVSHALTSTMDLFSTSLALADVAPPDDRVIDGRSLLPLFDGTTEEIRDFYPFYRGEQLYAARLGPWKAHYITQWAYTSESDPEQHDPALLFHLENDPSEQFSLSEERPDVLEQIRAAVADHDAKLERGPVQLDARLE